MGDTADEIAKMSELIHSARNRAETAQILLDMKREDLMITSLEDLFCGCQLMLDYCVDSPLLQEG